MVWARPPELGTVPIPTRKWSLPEKDFQTEYIAVFFSRLPEKGNGRGDG